MIGALESDERPQSPGEEIANSVSHGVGLVAALVGVPILIVAAVRRGGAAGIVGASVFAGTMVLLYLASTLYHALPKNKAKRVFQVLDHGAIFTSSSPAPTLPSLSVCCVVGGVGPCSVSCGAWRC